MLMDIEDITIREFLRISRLEKLEYLILIRQADFQRTKEYMDEKSHIKRLVEDLIEGRNINEAKLVLEERILDVEDMCYREGYKACAVDSLTQGIVTHGVARLDKAAGMTK